MSLVTIDEVKTVMSAGVKNDALQAIIDRCEGWLADDPNVGIGPLSGERTQTLFVRNGDAEPLLLQRPTAELASVTDDGVALTSAEYALTGPARLERVAGTWHGPQLAVKYTPTDAAAVKQVVLELVALALTASPFQQESSEGHQYGRPLGGQERERYRLARSLHPHTQAMSTHLRSAVDAGRLTD